MATRPIPALEFPPSDPAYERALGQFVIAWGQLEAEIDCAVEELFDVAEPLDNVITANLMTKTKLDIFRAAIHAVAPAWGDKSLVDDVNKLAQETADAADEWRTHYAHGQPITAEGESGEDIWVWIKRAARKGGLKEHATFMRESTSDIARFVATGLVVRWHEMREVIACYKSGRTMMRSVRIVQSPDKRL